MAESHPEIEEKHEDADAHHPEVAEKVTETSDRPTHLIPEVRLTLEEAEAEAKVASEKLFFVYDKLHTLVLGYEDTIKKRWGKRSRSKKHELLLEVYPGMPRNESLKPEELVKYPIRGIGGVLFGTIKQDFVVPYVNSTALTVDGGSKFLSLLHYRAHLLPSAFAQYDRDQIHFGGVTGLIGRRDTKDAALLCHGDSTTYGKLVSWRVRYDDNMMGMALEMRGDAMAFREVLPVFDFQTKLLTFLLNAAEKILEGVDLNTIPPAQDPLPPPEIPSIPTINYGWDSVALQSSLRPYLHPDEFSFPAFSALVQSQYDLAKDHLISLRTDPQYLAEQLQQHFDHRGELTSKSRLANTSFIQDRAAAGVIVDAYRDFSDWHLILEAAKKAHRKYQELGGKPARGKRLPPGYEEGFIDAHVLLVALKAQIKLRYSMAVSVSPPFRDYFEVSFKDQRLHKSQVRYTGPSGDRLVDLLVGLLEDERMDELEVSQVFAELDLIPPSTDQNARITPRISMLLAQAASIHDALEMINLHRPKVDLRNTDDFALRLKRLTGLLRSGFDTYEGKQMNLSAVAFPVSMFEYPKAPKKNEAWVSACESVDNAFATFWAKADRQLLPVIGEKVQKMVQTFVDPLLVRKEQWADFVRKKGATPVAKGPVSQEALLEELGVSPAILKSQKGKKKKRGQIPDAAEQESVPIPPPSDPTPALSDTSTPSAPPEQIPVPARTHKTLRNIFRLTSSDEISSQLGSVMWSDVLQAFSQLGFTILKTRGTSWRFTKAGEESSFSVYAPHPEPNLDFWKARRLGLCLTRRFGWTIDTFVLEKGTPPADKTQTQVDQ
ncbi:hypothetical protein BV22DRAFT_1039175 [Leucogyrophana mollusca]|uniref:Uncharacterized protein n=1 Tax=Leucogyrophana mollusca TaxID=85980 RepID=A0ACB8B6S0_9AGAM|nr:hypothetical protein BV22DRAFT_1039175 [Leucogyrophana mollusca]